MITALVVGLGIGLLQAVTQIQEQPGVRSQDRRRLHRAVAGATFAGAALSGLMTDIAGRIAAY